MIANRSGISQTGQIGDPISRPISSIRLSVQAQAAL
jgi:hypothetical protein